MSTPPKKKSKTELTLIAKTELTLTERLDVAVTDVIDNPLDRRALKRLDKILDGMPNVFNLEAASSAEDLALAVNEFSNAIRRWKTNRKKALKELDEYFKFERQ